MRNDGNKTKYDYDIYNFFTGKVTTLRSIEVDNESGAWRDITKPPERTEWTQSEKATNYVVKGILSSLGRLFR